jgi:hypothetical protein
MSRNPLRCLKLSSILQKRRNPRRPKTSDWKTKAANPPTSTQKKSSLHARAIQATNGKPRRYDGDNLLNTPLINAPIKIRIRTTQSTSFSMPQQTSVEAISACL